MKKRLMVVMGLAVAALGIGATAAVLGTTPAVFTRATGETRSIVLTATDFSVGTGNFSKSGMEFHYEGVKIDGNTVTLDGGRVYMTMAHYSGDSISEGGLRGNGFTALAITDLDVDGDGYIVYAKPGTSDDPTGTYSVAANIDLTHQNGGGEVLSANRRRIHVEAGPGKISFTKLTFSYECVEATPTVVISGDASVNKGSTLNLTAETTDIANTATYTWTSLNTDVATIVGDGKSATVTGVAGGNATIKVQAIVDEDVVASDTYAITVIEEAATYQKVEVLASSKWVGAGLNYHINPSSAGKTSAELGSLSFSMELTSLTGSALSFKMDDFHNYGEGSILNDDDTNIYLRADRVPGNSEKYALRLEFRDAPNNTIYYAVAKFEGTSFLPDVQITAPESSVDEKDTLVLTAVINDEDFTPASYVWASSDDTVATVVGNNLSATVTGVKAGTADITLTVTGANSDIRVGTFALTVTDPSNITYLGWDKYNTNVNHGPLYFQGAGMWIAVDLSSIGRTSGEVNGELNKISLVTSKASPSIVNFQNGGANTDNREGLYVTFPDADFSTLTSITLRVPDNHGVLAVAEMTLSWNAGVRTILTLNGQPFADYMAPKQGE